MKSISHGIVRLAHEVGHEEDGALEDADEQQVAAGVVGRDLRRRARAMRALQRVLVDEHLGDGPLELSRAHASTSGCSTMPGNGDDLVAAHDERPRLALGARDLRVDEHVLDLLLPAREPVAGPPASHFKPFELASGSPRRPSAPRRRASTGPALEPEPVVLAHRLDAAAEVDALRAGRRGEQLGERGRQRLARCRARAGGSRRRPGCSAAQERQDLVADQAALRVGVDESTRKASPSARAVGRGLLAPERQQRVHDAVVAARRDAGRRCRARRAGRGSSRPGRRRCGPLRAAGRHATE